jgi:signal transduction histidine kinase
MNFRLTWLCLGLLAGVLPASAQAPVVLYPRLPEYNLGPRLEYLEDPSGVLTLPDVFGRHDFVRSRAETPSFGLSSSVFWFRVCLRNGGTDPNRQYLLELGYSHFRGVDLYVFDEKNRLVEQTLAGNARGAAHRPLPTHHYVFPLRLPPGETRTVYLRADGMASKIFPLTVYEERHFYAQAGDYSLWLGFYFGFVTIIALYHLLLFGYTSDRGYLYFSLYLLSYWLGELLRSNGNFAERYVLVYHPFWQQRVVQLLNLVLTLASWFGILFYRQGLQITPDSVLGRVLTGLWLTNAAAFLLVVTLPLPTWVPLAFNFYVPAVVYLSLFMASLAQLMQGFRPAAYYALGTGVFLVGVILVFCNRLGVLPGTTFFLHNAVQLASIAEILLLSLGFAESLRQERRRRKLDLLRSHLGGRKQEREWLSVVLHNLFGNTITFLARQLATLQSARFTPEQRTTYEEMRLRLDEADRELRTLARSLLPPVLDKHGLCEALNVTVANFNSLKETHITLTSTGDERRLDERLEFELYLVGLELLNNVVRHARATAARLELRWEPTALELTMSDNGRGFEVTDLREGYGFGSTRKFVERTLHGSFAVRSRPGAGTTVRIWVPFGAEPVAVSLPAVRYTLTRWLFATIRWSR